MDIGIRGRSNRNNPEIDIVMMEPDKAAVILRENENGGVRIRGADIESYAEDIRTGQWALNGDAIIFDKEGRLIDGFHRLKACVLANHAFPTFIIDDIDPASAVTIDTHRKRKNSDILHIAGHDDTVSLAAAAAMAIHVIERVPLNHTRSLPNRVIKPFIDANPQLVRSVAYVADMRTATPGPSIMAAIHFLATLIDPEKARLFFEGFDREVATAEDPTNAPYRTLAASMQSIRSLGLTSGSMREYVQIYTIKAWNAFHDGARLAKLKHDGKQNVPAMKGLVPGMVSTGAKKEVEQKDVNLNYVQSVHDTEISMSVETITPAVAESLLENNGPLLEDSCRNRRQSALAVDQYAKDMKAGNWALNGQSIKVSASGRLLDGQHRASACIKSGISFETIVVRGLPDTIFGTLDLHSKKQFSATLARLRFPNPGTMASALRIIWRHENHGLDTTLYPTQSELNDTLDRHGRHLSTSVSYSRRKSVTDMIKNSGVIAGGHYILSCMDPMVSDEFFEGFATGASLDKGNPILALRNRFAGEKSASRKTVVETYRLIFLTRCWRAYQEGREISVLRGGMEFEPFFRNPHPIGEDKENRTPRVASA